LQRRSDSIVRHPHVVERWAGIGLHGVLLGQEGASDSMLTSVDKKCTARQDDEAIRILQANGIVIWGAFIVDLNWPAEDFDRLRDYVVRNGAASPSSGSLCSVFPGLGLVEPLLSLPEVLFDMITGALLLPFPRWLPRFLSLPGVPALGASHWGQYA
jgi:hypothetical protein